MVFTSLTASATGNLFIAIRTSLATIPSRFSPGLGLPLCRKSLSASPRANRPRAPFPSLTFMKASRAWPKDTRIKALRVYQVLPMSVPSGDPPHETGIRLPQSQDSVNIARAVLGTVPVEADGSAHFTVPARRELFFQALDERGLAVTSMRSATQVQPGEHLTCQGCHEPRHRAPRRADANAARASPRSLGLAARC